MSVAADPGGDRRVHAHDSAALSDVEHEGVHGDECEQSGRFQPPRGERLDLGAEDLGHLAELALVDELILPRLWTNMSMCRVSC